MNKLKLQFDELAVESFPTDGEGEALFYETRPNATEAPTCRYTCYPCPTMYLVETVCYPSGS